MNREKASLFDNLQHLVRTRLSTAGYSTRAWANAARTRISATVFVARHWRRRDFAVSGLLCLFGLAAGVYGVVGSSTTTGKFALMLSIASLATPPASLLRKWSTFHRNHSFGPKKDLRLSAGFLIDKKSPYREIGPFHLAEFQATPGTKLIHVSRREDPAVENYMLFDCDISSHLLSNHIYCSPTSRGEYFHFSTRDILADSSQHAQTQIEVLGIHIADAMANKKSFFDSKKLSIASLDFVGDRLTATLGTSSYYCTMVTNDAAAKVITDKVGRVVNDDTLSMFPRIEAPKSGSPSSKYEILPLSRTCGLSNHIGSVVAAISSDNIPVLCFQNRNAKIMGGRSVLSGSGSLERSDFLRSGASETGRLDDAIRYGMARELLEETGGIPQDSLRRFDHEILRSYSQRIELVGYYRDLRRGGLPIFVGFCKMEKDFETIRTRRASRIWGVAAPEETTIDESLPRVPIHSAEEYGEYLRRYVRPIPVDKVERRPGDQVLLIGELLRIEPVIAHFEKMLAY